MANHNLNGAVCSSAFIQHLWGYPLVNDSVSTFMKNRYGQKSILFSESAYGIFVRPVMPYLAKRYMYTCLLSYIKKVDSFGDQILSIVDKRFPIVKESTEELCENISLRFPYPHLKSPEGKNQNRYVYDCEREAGNEITVIHSKDIITTALATRLETSSSSESSSDKLSTEFLDRICGDSEDGFSPESWEIKKKRAIMDRLMLWAKAWLESRLALLSYQQVGDGSHASQGTELPLYESDANQSEPVFGIPRKLGGDREDGHGEEESGSGEGHEGNKRAKQSENPPLFACPYFQRDPDRYRVRRSCPGPGWREIHRLKDHLYRRHALGEFRCSRCCGRFKDDRLLTQHLRAPNPCELNFGQPQDDAFDKAQESKVRSIRRGTPDMTVWCEVYKILFPDDQHLPSPYYSFVTTNSGIGQSGNFSVFQQEVTRQFNDQMLQQLESRVNEIYEEHLGSPASIAEISESAWGVAVQNVQQAWPLQGTTNQGQDPMMGILFPEMGCLLDNSLEEPWPSYPNEPLTNTTIEEQSDSAYVSRECDPGVGEGTGESCK